MTLGSKNMTKGHAPREPLKESMLLTWRQIVDPLVDLISESGVTVQEVVRLVKERAVRAAAKAVRDESGRVSNSRIAIMTGLSRSEVSRLLRTKNSQSIAGARQLHAGGRVLAAWHDSAAFRSSNGAPEILPIFGKRRSFENLVQRNGGGIPVRAMLDYLLQIKAVEILPGQLVRANSRIPAFTGLSHSAITKIGELTGDLLATLRGNLRKSENRFFEGTALISDADMDMIPVIRREIAEQGASFIESANSLLRRHGTKFKQPSKKAKQAMRIGVTLFYFQNNLGDESTTRAGEFGTRRNLKRRMREVPCPKIRSNVGRKKKGD